MWLKRKFNGHDPQLLLQRAATLIIFLLLTHSLVDYPLRTTALSSIFMFFCAVLATKLRTRKMNLFLKRGSAPVAPKPSSRVTPGESGDPTFTGLTAGRNRYDCPIG